MSVSRRQFTRLAASALAVTAVSRSTFGQISGADSGPADLTGMTLAEASAKFQSGAVTSVQLTEACLARIGTYNPKLDAFITVMAEKARADAKLRDQEFKAGKNRGLLHGIPIALKDNIDTAGTRTTAGSAVFEDRVPTEDATVTAR